MSPQEAERFPTDWRGWWARPNQLPPKTNWQVWLVLAGRGFGKSRTGAEWVREKVETKQAGRLALIGPTTADVRDVMVEGDSGILARSPKHFRPEWKPSKRRLTWPNGAIATTYSADKPDRLRGPQHDGAWADEAAVWRYGPEAWDMLMFGLRLGNNPQVVVTTTPKPVKLIRELLARKGQDVEVTHGTTYENRSNLAEQFLKTIITRYEGTRLGRQELLAELLEDVPGALWQRLRIEELRVLVIPQLTRIVVAIDPAASSQEKSDETGIIVAGIGEDGHGYVLNDLSGRYTPTEWAKKAIAAYRLYKADRIVAEINNGGEMVEATLRSIDADIPYRGVHASRGKAIRAEPISALYEQGKVHHVGTLALLEDQQCAFTIDFDRKTMGYSPDRLDALVWALTELMGSSDFEGWVEYVKRDAKQMRESQELPGPEVKDSPRPKPEAGPDGGDLLQIYQRALEAAGAGVMGDVCAGCGKPIAGERIENGQSWHPACFKPSF
jgi:phage terminase large subunit-like protein